MYLVPASVDRATPLLWWSPPRTHNNRAAVRDNCGQRKRGCTCFLIDRVTAASKTEGVPAVSSIESLMIRRPFGSIDPNSIRETELHEESAGRPQYGTRYQNSHFDFPTYCFFLLLLDTYVQHLERIPTSFWFCVWWHIPTSAFFHSYQIRTIRTHYALYITCS